METITTEILVVGGGTGGTAAAIQAARRGVQVVLVSEFPWLGGMLTTAGVTAPDGNELAAFQTGIWGHFLRELEQRQRGGLDHAWVSFFTYEPGVGAAIFADWVRSLPNLHWIAGEIPREVLKQGDRVTGVRFENFTVQAAITLDGTELGDLLALGEVPHRWGWEWQAEFQEPSAPPAATALTDRYPVQAPTWVVIMQDFGAGNSAPEIPPPPTNAPHCFEGAWENYGAESFLNYGRLPGDRFMINWPQRGNDYGMDLQRLVESATTRQQFFQEARWHSQSFARYIQQQLGRRYGLATDTFPQYEGAIGGGAYALHPYFRESRRLRGCVTVREQDILPIAGGQAAVLPVDEQGSVEAIALGNYPNDHHYPDLSLPLQPKSLRWGGRWTGTPFALPYRCLVPQNMNGLMVCEKNISVSHIANGATRLQPLVLALGQAAGMAAALCVESSCDPRELPVRALQEALLQDAIAPAAVIPLFNLPPHSQHWQATQKYYLDHPEQYPAEGYSPVQEQSTKPHRLPSIRQITPQNPNAAQSHATQSFEGWVERLGEQHYQLTIQAPSNLAETSVSVVALQPKINEQLAALELPQSLQILGRLNLSGNWLIAESIKPV